MPRLMSVSLTTPQVRARTKTVTRRLGWEYAKPGDRLTLCEKVMGRKKGEPLVRICDVEIVAVRREVLAAITADDVAREGFPDWTPDQFIDMFCSTHKPCSRLSYVTRIEWQYLPQCFAVDVDGHAAIVHSRGRMTPAEQDVMRDIVRAAAALPIPPHQRAMPLYPPLCVCGFTGQRTEVAQHIVDSNRVWRENRKRGQA